MNHLKKYNKKSKKKLDPYKIAIGLPKYEEKLNTIHNECFNEEKPYITKDMISMILISQKSGRAMCYLLVEPINNYECFIWSICTGLKYRSRGCIQTLLNKVFLYFSHYKKFSLYVNKQNEPALHLYKKMGFVIDPTYNENPDNYKMSKINN
jgi:ribosomal protein S18 acetylase RimI-like enzyme